MKMLDLFCGRFGWGRAFAERGWEVVGVDLVAPPEIPDGCTFIMADVLSLRFDRVRGFWISCGEECVGILGFFDVVCMSSPCEQFSLFGMAHFHPNPPYPALGIELFNHGRGLCEASCTPYIAENVRPAQKFLGKAENHCGPFYLWGTAVPLLMPMGIKKGIKHAAGFHKSMTGEEKRMCRLKDTMLRSGSKSKVRREHTARAATIPPELAFCVADYAARLCEQTVTR